MLNKIILVAVAAFFLPAIASAGVPDPDMVKSSATVLSGISVSESVATQIDTDSRRLADRFVVVIDNEGSDSIRCGFSSSVTQTTNGFLIRAGVTYAIKLSPNIRLWCMATGASPVLVSLTQGASS